MKKTAILKGFTALLFVVIAMPSVAQHKDYHHTMLVGYLNKNWITDFSGTSYKENIFGEEGKRFHGMQIGYRYNTCTPVGLGIQTGLSYEFCMSYSDRVKEMGFDRFNEHSLYVPLHAMFRIPISYDASISPYAGVGVNWKVNARLKSGTYSSIFTDYDDYWYDRWAWENNEFANVRYGRDGWPHALNAQLECGVNVRVSDFVLGVTYSYGLTDHEFYEKEQRKTRQDKIAITLGICVE